MVVGFITTYATSAYHHISREFESISLCDKVGQWLLVDRWLFPSIPVSSNNKTDRHDIAEILLKVALNIITLTAFSMSQQIVNHDSFCNKYNIATAGVDLIKMA